MDEVVAIVLRGGLAALRVTKRVLAGSVMLLLDDAAVARAAGVIAEVRAGPETHEGVAAFLEKRQPMWPTP